MTADQIKSPDQRIDELTERIKTLEAQLTVADQIFQNVQKALVESEFQDAELLQHIEIFLDNNQILLGASD